MINTLLSFFLILILVSGSLTIAIPTSVSAEESKIFPEWVRTVFKFWANGDISDSELKNSLEYLLKEKILDLEEKKKPTTNLESSIKDDNIFTQTQNAINDAIKKIHNDPILDAVVSGGLEAIPIAGPMLTKLYENSKGTPTEKNQQILAILEEYKKMDAISLEKAFTKLEENKNAIENNTYLLGNLLSDTKQILEITSDTNTRVKNLEAKLAQISSQLSAIRLGTTTPQISEELQNQLTEITQLNSEISDNENLDSSHLGTLAKSYVLQNDYDDAITIYDQILNDDPKNQVALLEKAWALFGEKKYAEAIDAFDTLLRYYPDNVEGWDGKGWTWLEEDVYNPTKSRLSFEESFRIDNSNIYALTGLMWVYIETGDCTKAREQFNLAISIDRDHEEITHIENELNDFCP